MMTTMAMVEHFHKTVKEKGYLASQEEAEAMLDYFEQAQVEIQVYFAMKDE